MGRHDGGLGHRDRPRAVRADVSRATPRIRLFALCAALLPLACDDVTSAELDDVEVHILDDGVRIENGRDHTIYHFMADQVELALLDWVPCRDPETCAGVEPGGSVVVPDEHVIGWHESDVLVVYWWELHRQPGGEYEVDRIRTMKVDY